MANKMRSKGTVLKVTIATVLTAIPQIISIDKTGEEGESYDGRTLDQASPTMQKPSTGYVSPPVIGGELFYDSANTVHAAIKTLMRAPADTVFTLTYTDAGPVVETWTVSTVGWDEKFAGNDGVKASFKLTCSGPSS